MRLVLASASPRRRELLAGLGVPFEVAPSRAPERVPPGLNPSTAAATALELARAKARNVAARLDGEALVIGADTLVVLPDRVLGKPASSGEAREMLRALSGRGHTVVTGVVIIETTTGRSVEGVEETRVFFRNLDDEAIRAYLATGEPADKAGAYAVQGLGSLLVERIEGCYFNVVGLPLGRLAGLLKEVGYDLLAEAASQAAQGGGGTRRSSRGPAQ